MTTTRSDVRLAELTTLRVGGPARRYVEATTEDELVGVVTDCDRRGEPVLILGGGSNLVVSDDGFDGTVVHVRTTGVVADGQSCGPDYVAPALDDPADDDAASCGGVLATVAAGEPWDGFVRRAIGAQWIGVEALSGIPGAVGATPMQNVGAYGQEVADTIWSVRTFDRADRAVRTFAAAECAFGYRTSRFMGDDRYLVLAVTFQFRQGDLGAPVRYAELARVLGVDIGARASSSQIRDAVLGLRRGKGMVLDVADHDSWSAGSFFTNPILGEAAAAALPADAPRWPVAGGGVKTSAAWLIEHAGFHRGHPGPGGRVALSGKHTLALTNRGDGTAADVVALAREVRDGVQSRFGVTLVNEPVLVGLSL